MNWEDELEEICGEEYFEAVRDLIESLLKDQRFKYYYHIENSSGTREADYIDKMVNSEPGGIK